MSLLLYLTRFKIYSIIFLIILLGFTPLLSFKSGFIIDSGPMSIPLDPVLSLQKVSFSWTDLEGLGSEYSRSHAVIFPYYLIFYILKLTNLDIEIIEKIFIIILFMLPGFSMYYLCKTLMKENHHIFALFASLFYMFNIFTLFLFSNPIMNFILAYGMIPFLLAFYVKGLNEDKYIQNAILLGIVSLFNAPTGNNPVLIIIQTGIILSYFLWFLFINKAKIIRLAALRFTLISGILVFLLNSWWLLPQIYNALVYNPISSVEMFEGYSRYLLYNFSETTSFSNVFRLFGYWIWDQTINGAPYYIYISSFRTVPLNLISFIFPLLAFSSIIFCRKNKNILFWTFLSLIGLFLIKGIHDPNGNIFLWLFNNFPGFWMFRSHYDKFGYIIALSYAILIGITINEIYIYIKKINKFHSHIFLMLSCLLILLFPWTFWAGHMFGEGNQYIPSSHIKIPSYYYEFSSYINKESNNFRILSLPNQKSSDTAYIWGYLGSDITNFLVSKPLINFGGYQTDGASQSLNELFILINNNSAKNVSKSFALFNIKYILLHNDINWKFYDTNSPKQIKSIVSNQKSVHLERSFGDLDLYNISNDYFLPLIYPAKSLYLINGSMGDMIQFVMAENYTIGNNVIILSNQTKDEQLDLLNIYMKKYDELTKDEKINIKNPQIFFKKINPTKYQIKIENATEPFFIVFSESYHSGWKAYVEDKKIKFDEIIADYDHVKVKEASNEMSFNPIDINYLFAKPLNEKNHFIVNGYANGWYLDPQELDTSQNFTITIYFKPQSYFYIGVILLFVTLIGCIVYLVWNRWKGRLDITKKIQKVWSVKMGS